MSREIRRVPPNWEHPKNEDGHYVPMYDYDFDTALEKWLAGYTLWKKGEHEDQIKHPQYKDDEYWLHHGGPPDPDYCRPAYEEEPTWFQVYETVSEGTPVTPPFPTKEMLVEYLVEHGTFWDQGQWGKGGWSRESAEYFAKAEWAPSLLVFAGPEEVKVFHPRDISDKVW